MRAFRCLFFLSILTFQGYWKVGIRINFFFSRWKIKINFQLRTTTNIFYFHLKFSNTLGTRQWKFPWKHNITKKPLPSEPHYLGKLSNNEPCWANIERGNADDRLMSSLFNLCVKLRTYTDIKMINTPKRTIVSRHLAYSSL